MNERKITVASTKANKPVTFKSAAATWGDLKNELSSNNVEFNDKMNAVLKNTRTNLVLDDAVLPEEDIIIFLMAKKMKSGTAKKSTAKKAPAKKSTAKKPAKKAPAKSATKVKAKPAPKKKTVVKKVSKADEALMKEATEMESKLKRM